MFRKLDQAVVTAGSAVLLVLGAVACGGGDGAGDLARDDVASTIGAQLQEQGVQAEDVSCPEDLPAEVGRSVRCEFVVDGQPVDAVATVGSVEGETVRYDIRTEARPVAEDLLEEKVAQQVAEQAGVPVDEADCTGDLPAQVDGTVGCAVTGGGETASMVVTVTSVDGGQVNYSITRV
jgi:Domain of unknown function (DUF4333)